MSSETTLKAGYSQSLFVVTTLTNLHAGSGKNNYGVIDNLVQRDVLTSWPTIHASSLKGALRQYCFDTLKNENKAKITHIFGADTNEGENSQGGAYVFLPAQLLSIPVRSDVRPFFRATCPKVIGELIETADSFGVDLPAGPVLEQFRESLSGDAIHSDPSLETETPYIEALDLQAKYKSMEGLVQLEPLLGDNLVLLSDERFSELVDDENLPIIARNNLENGISRNLWYEQIVPRQSRFFTLILAPKGDPHQAFFNQHLQEQAVQVGANASIGYGFCTFKKIG